MFHKTGSRDQLTRKDLKMHPYHHALSSARRYGGAAEDYLPLHNWFDATKANMSFFTHRALRHHYEGVREAVHVFGGHVTSTEGTSVAVETISLQHFMEDMSIIPSAADWLQHIDRSKMPEFTTIPTAEELADRSARRFATTPSVVLPVHQWFFETATWFTDQRHLTMRHHSFGIFETEQRFGVVLTDGSSPPVPTRVLGEWHVRAVLGRIPTAAEFIRLVKGQPWMAAAQNPRRLGLI
jgi:hypothetical protein